MKDRNNLFATFVTQFASTKKLVLLFSTPAEVIFYEDILSHLEISECVLLHSLMNIEEQIERWLLDEDCFREMINLQKKRFSYLITYQALLHYMNLVIIQIL